MTSSLLVDSAFELLNEGDLITTGRAAGATIRLDTSNDFGDPIPQTDLLSSLLLDGERPTGRRSSNRSIQLPVAILGPPSACYAARELLMQAVDQDTWELAYTPDGLPTTIFDCFRATPTSQQSLLESAQGVLKLGLQIPALPFGRSADIQTVDFDLVPILVEDFGTPILSGWTAATTPRSSGANSVTRATAGNWRRTGGPFDLSDMATIRLKGGGRFTSSAYRQPLTISLELTSGGIRYNLGPITHQVRNGVLGDYTWHLHWPTGFDPSNINDWSITTTAGSYIDDLRAMPPASSPVITNRGGIYLINGVDGTARTPIALDLSRPDGSQFEGLLVHRAPPDAPADYTPLIPYPHPVSNGVEQTLPEMIDGQGTLGLRYDGTCAIWLYVAALAGDPTVDRTVKVVFRQFFNDTGVTGADHPNDHGFASVSRTFNGTDTNGNFLYVGALTLPTYQGTEDTTASKWTVAVTSTTIADNFDQVMALDTRGQTVVVAPSYTRSPHIYIDPPDPTQQIGVIAGGSDRAHALSLLGDSIVTGGPISLDPGDNTLLVMSFKAPVLTVSYQPRWRSIRAW